MSAVELHYEAHGRSGAPVLLLVGSLGSSLRMWDPQVPELAGDLRAVAVDVRGHGGSPVPSGPYGIADLGADLVALLDRLGVGRAHVAGLSLGGMAAMWLAAHHPERVGRLALLATAAQLGAPGDWRERAATVREGGTEAVADAVVARWFTPALAERDPGLVARHREMVVATPDEGYAGCCEAIADMDQRDDLARILAPTLAIAGADDPATPPDTLRGVADAVPDGRLAVVDQGAHLLNVEQAETVTGLLHDHLTAAEGSR